MYPHIDVARVAPAEAAAWMWRFRWHYSKWLLIPVAIGMGVWAIGRWLDWWL